ncbi:Excalibur calcium-binding domain-containing protein [Geodermatophilus africanus]|uniref:Excalibur calcium-binding domain-containing protein n=1 Tax=Geodermatophilus africanus TaxID=1137993 RepID=A0A1H3CNC3_9ACTN|nr:excalibur calcium-binding domain-containing protein [Geodermatophilus africanus]SDX55378.1 Excalibur calcium-binding domain-containing protein [Geodermatophilus africanus]
MWPTKAGTQLAQTMELPAPPPAEVPRKQRKWLRWGIPLVAFLLGIGVGGAGDQPDVTTTPQYQSLQAEMDTAQDEADELSDEVAAAEERVQTAAAAAQARIEQQSLTITQRATDLDQREQDLIARESAVRAAEQAATSRTGTSSSSSSSSSSSGSVSSGAGNASVAEPEPQVSAIASYANCTEARAAGAAPVRVGDPGYGRHLDRDGDGVGCE